MKSTKTHITINTDNGEVVLPVEHAYLNAHKVHSFESGEYVAETQYSVMTPRMVLFPISKAEYQRLQKALT